MEGVTGEMWMGRSSLYTYEGWDWENVGEVYGSNMIMSWRLGLGRCR